MTNETTASQPKSIGDDALVATVIAHCNDLADCAFALQEHGGFAATAQEILIAVTELRAACKLRAPAAQASATIQTIECGYDIGPERKAFYEGVRAVQSRLDRIAKGWDGCNAHGITSGKGLDVGAWLRTEFAALDSLRNPGVPAATILQPVMVAEPVGVARQALIDLRELHISTPTHFNAYIDIIDKALNHAAPMVADPAGVIPPEATGAEEDYELAVQRGWNNCRAAMLAATVKAVPSEALDEAGIRNAALEDAAKMLLNGYFLHDAAPRKLFAGEAAKAIREMKIAAPLADKADGGE